MSHDEQLPPPRALSNSRSGSVGRILFMVIALIALGSALYSGLRDRKAAGDELANDVKENAAIAVSVALPQQSEPGVTGMYPANLRAYVETPIYARTNGYLKRWLVDIGAKVKEGQLLAEIETPEVDQQLKQAEATVAAAQSMVDLDATTAKRYQDLLKSDGVSKQEVDTANGTDRKS